MLSPGNIVIVKDVDFLVTDFRDNVRKLEGNPIALGTVGTVSRFVPNF